MNTLEINLNNILSEEVFEKANQYVASYQSLVDDFNSIVRKRFTKTFKAFKKNKSLDIPKFPDFIVEKYNKFKNHPFRIWLRNQQSYHAALKCLIPKLQEFTADSEIPTITTQILFDRIIAESFSVYHDFEKKFPAHLLVTTALLSKIKRLAQTLADYVEKYPLFESIHQQREILETLLEFKKIEKRVSFLPKTRHNKLSREMLAKALLCSFHESWNCNLSYPYRRTKHPDTSFVNVVTHIMAIVDPNISERRIADSYTKIKPYLEANQWL